MFEENEVLTLILGVVALLIIAPVSSRISKTGLRSFRMGIVFLATSYLFTNLESWILPRLCHFLEHMLFAAAGCAMLYSVHRLQKGDDFR